MSVDAAEMVSIPRAECMRVAALAGAAKMRGRILHLDLGCGSRCGGLKENGAWIC
jgi:hypothetical protein